VSVVIAFTLIYKFLPNTFVSLKSAFAGAVLATLAWKAVGYGFAVFIRNSANYDIIYSGFAALIVFLLWLYITWLIILLGAQFNYFFQNTSTDK
jgi:membrane protein